jgi:hypothetical protein
MAISHYWNTVVHFTAVEATYLILGLEPEEKERESLKSVTHLMQRMHVAYINSCGHYRLWLENEHEWDVVMEPEPVLLSAELLDHYFLCRDAPTLTIYAECQQFFLRWLDEALDRFQHQKFHRWHIEDWLDDNNIPSEFDFGGAMAGASTESPEERRERVREMLRDQSGNKSAVARAMGVSRQRVDQLLGEKSSKGKPLRINPQDPFGLAGRALANEDVDDLD